MKLHTASETVSFVKELEEKSAIVYEALSRRHSKDKDIFLSFARESRKYVTQIQRAYYSVITDAIEGGYAFDLETNNYIFEANIPESVSYSDALEMSIEMEEKILNFYAIAAVQSGSLLADVPRNFKIVAKKRRNRIPTLKSLFDESQGQER